MALSEHEQRLLAEMERALYAEDPRFASSIRDSRMTTARSSKNLFFAFLAIGGISLIAVGAMAAQTFVSVGGFIAAVAGLYGLVKAFQTKPAAGNSTSKSNKPARKGFLRGAEDRFEKRRDNRNDI